MSTPTTEGPGPMDSHAPRSDADFSRRQFVAAGAALGLSAAAVQAGQRSATRKPRPRVGGTSSVNSFDAELVLLINRATGGFSLDEYALAESLGYDGYLNQLLSTVPSDIAAGQFDPALDARLINFDILPWSAQQIRDVYKFQGGTSSIVALRQTVAVQIMMATYGQAQLYYRMVQFWNHHLNIDINSNTHQRWLLWPFLRDVVLTHAMGTAPELILASAQGGAMMKYLDNTLSTKNQPNENYAREIQELHTLGLDNGYTQTDIEELARILTGWGVCQSEFGCSNGTQEYGQFRFTSNDHDYQQKTWLGIVFPFDGNDGFQEGVDAINILTAHENTAEFIARKLCRFFLGGINSEYDPAEAHVQLIKSIYLDTAGDIPAMLAVLLSREVLADAQPKYRRPLDAVSAALRATGAAVTPTASAFTDNGSGVARALRAMGMQPSGWGPPNGPFDSDIWAQGNALERWKFFDRLAEQNLGDTPNFTIGGAGGLLAQVDAIGPGAHAQGLSDVLTGGRMTAEEVDDLAEFLGSNPSESRLQEGLALAMQMPTFQFI